MTSPNDSERLHALDAVRGLALTLGVVFHASMSFLPGVQVWIVRDHSTSPVAGVLFFVLHIFRMTTFFVIAGYFGRLMLQRRGVVGFMRDRGKRIAIPFVVGWPIVLAAIIAVSVWAAVQATGHVPPPPPPPVPFGFPLTHLWFLYVLIWLYAGMLALRGLVGLIDRSGRLAAVADVLVRGVVTWPLAVIALAVPFTIAVITSPAWLMWFGVPTPDSSLVINTVALAAYGTAFGFGWLMQRQDGLIQTLVGKWPLNLGLAVALTVGLLVVATPTPIVTPAPHDLTSVAFAAAYGVAAWTWTFGLIGLALRFLSGHSPARRYLADASYWIYIVHLPLVLALQTIAAPLPGPWWIKLPLILVVAFAVMLASYEGLVRYSFIGAILNGRRQVRAGRQPLPSAPQSQEAAS